jgi:hypothetical protein
MWADGRESAYKAWRQSLRRKVTSRDVIKFKHSFPEDLFDSTVDGKETLIVRRAKWKDLDFHDAQEGAEFVRLLFGGRPLPSRKLEGITLTHSKIARVGYSREHGKIRIWSSPTSAVL